MKLKNCMQKALPACVLLVTACVFLTAATAEAQLFSSLWGSSSWWDWSDYRASVGFRMSLPRITGTVEARGETHNLSEFGFADDPEFFKSLHMEFYVDRLGIRVDVEEDFKFRGRTEAAAVGAKISELDFSGTRLGLDLDIIRTPFVRGGIDFTYFTNQVKFQDRRLDDPTLWQQYTGSQPFQMGVHGRLMPGRIRDVPITFQAKFRMPIPLVQRPTEAKITEWEVSGGLRPAIWETSLLGHSTFSFGIEGGYRHCYLTLHARPQRDPNVNDDDEANVTAQWGGAFVQAVVYY